MSPLITVLTAVRNGARYLEEAIASIRAQTITDWEHIVVDDASEDESASIVDRLARNDARLQLVRRTVAGGPYVAANDGLRVAGGRYVARIDADDAAVSNRLEVQLAFLREHPGLRACGGFHRPMSATGEIRPVIRRVPLRPGTLRWRLCVTVDPSHSSAFAERSAFEELGGYRPLPLAQDWRLWCELSRRGWLGIVPEVVTYRRVHDDRLSHQEGELQARYAEEVAQEHIRELSGQEWPIQDVRLLRLAAHGRPVRLMDELNILSRWAALSRSDATLTLAERRDIALWTRKAKLRLGRRWCESIRAIGPIVRIGLAGGDKLRTRVAALRGRHDAER